MSNPYDFEEVIDEMTMVNPHQGVKKGMPNLYLTNSKVTNPIFYDYAVDKNNTPISGRYGHSSVLVGDYLYVFGGLVDNGSGTKVCTNDFYRLHIASNVWLKIETVSNTPTARAFCVMQSKGNLIYLHGGVSYTSRNAPLPYNNTPQTAYNLPTGTVGSHSAGFSVVVESQKTFFAGTYVFDVHSDKWTKLTFTNLTVETKAYSSGFIYNNFFCVVNGLTVGLISQATSGATGTITLSTSFLYFNMNLATPTWTIHVVVATAVWGHKCLLVNNRMYRVFGNNTALSAASTNVNFTSIIYINLSIVSNALTFSLETTVTKSNSTNPASFMFFSLFYDSTRTSLQVFNGVSYSTTPAASTDVCYYVKNGGATDTRYYYIKTNENYFASTTFTGGKQAWVAGVGPSSFATVTNSTMLYSVAYYGSTFYLYGGRDAQYATQTFLNKIAGGTQSLITTYTPIRNLVNANKFSSNGFDFTVIYRNGNVYIAIHTTNGKSLSIYSLRVTSA